MSAPEDGEYPLAMIRGSKPAFLILDVTMPKKNGDDVCQEVKADAEFRDIHVMVLTAEGQKGDPEKGLAQDADEYVTKPVSPIKIAARVEELLG